jgi:ubiquinone/menaquinone biosynthesis C-methylase UbiE
LDEHEFAKSLLAHERREWQDPEKIISQIYVKRGASIADLACGPGFFVIPLARALGEEGTIYAVDKSKVMLEYLKSGMKKAKINPKIVKIIEADVTKTPIPSSSCNVVLFANILHDLDDPRVFLDEVKRIAKPSALIVNIDWKDVDNGFGPPLEIRLSEAKARKILEDNNFMIVKSIDAGPYHYGLYLKIPEKNQEVEKR